MQGELVKFRSSVTRDCPICDTPSVQYWEEDNSFNCTECDFRALSENTYGTTYIRGHVKYAPLSREVLLSRGKCCNSGCTNCPY